MSKVATSAFSHFGICVADLERASKFYVEAFAFELGALLSPSGPEVGELIGIEGEVALRCQFLVKEALLIQLIKFDQPGHLGQPNARQLNELGLTHLAFRVSQVEPILKTIERLGGRAISKLRRFEGGCAIYCIDPDGTRIEIMELPDTVRFDRV